MKNLFSAGFALLAAGCALTLSSCETHEKGCDMPPMPICGTMPPAADSSCSTLAIVRDKTGFDGCGMVLELVSPGSNGRVLEPVGNTWASFHAVDGQRVRVGYRPVEAASACMMGHPVEVTCITAAGTAGSN